MAGCIVVSYHSLLLTDGTTTEVMDSRDLLPVPGGGLVVGDRRVPYVYPFVCPHVRASVQPKYAEQFSDRVREAFWEGTARPSPVGRPQ